MTLWHGNANYGMIMQCWALQYYLKQLGHEPFIIRYIPKGSCIKLAAKKCLQLFTCLISKNYKIEYTKNITLKRQNDKINLTRNFDGFRKKHFNFSKLEYHYIEKLRLMPPMADCYIAGSDQIWRGSLNFKNLKAYFLDFGSNTTRRIAYAPSFGMKSYHAGEIGLLSKALRRFDRISCREYDGVNICKEAGYDAEKVEDPSLLLEKEEYLRITTPIGCNGYCFIYSLNITSPDQIYWDDLKKTRNLTDFIVTPAAGYTPSKEIFSNDVKYFYATPQEWLGLISGADMVVTSSFHGVVFAIIFNVKFAYVPLTGDKASTNNRVMDLLHALELEIAIVNSGNDYKRLISEDFNWEKVNKKKEELLMQSKEFLEKALEYVE